jgi:hypothetical protein
MLNFQVNIQFKTLLLLSSTFVFQTNVVASASDPGEVLHNEHCLSCHQPVIYTSEDRAVTSYSKLEQRVGQCELVNNLLWFQEEVENVTSYLNRKFYLFK